MRGEASDRATTALWARCLFVGQPWRSADPAAAHGTRRPRVHALRVRDDSRCRGVVADRTSGERGGGAEGKLRSRTPGLHARSIRSRPDGADGAARGTRPNGPDLTASLRACPPEIPPDRELFLKLVPPLVR